MTAVDSGAASPAAPRTGSGSAAPYPYSLPGIVKFSCAVHLLGGGCLAVQPSSWPWVLGSVALNHGAIAIGGLLPRSRWLGENWTRLPEPAVQRGEVAITLDDGPDPDVTPRVLDLLGQGGATASFFVIGQHAAAWPELVRAIAEHGHSVENHSFRHVSTFACYGPRRLHAEIEHAQEVISAAAGVAPRFFRPPVGLRNILMYPVLARLGLTHVSWTRRGLDTVTWRPQGVARRLTRSLRPGDILMMHDGHHRNARSGRAVVLEALPKILDRIDALGLKAVSLAQAAGW